jgi:hypothetical protein
LPGTTTADADNSDVISVPCADKDAGMNHNKTSVELDLEQVHEYNCEEDDGEVDDNSEHGLCEGFTEEDEVVPTGRLIQEE